MLATQIPDSPQEAKDVKQVKPQNILPFIMLTCNLTSLLPGRFLFSLILSEGFLALLAFLCAVIRQL